MKQEKCPYCGSKKFVNGVQDGYSKIFPEGKTFTLKSQVLYHTICLDCGTVVKSFVKNPSKLITKSKEKNK